MTPTEIIEALRLARLSRRMTQDQLAESLGTTPQSIGKWERGINFPNFETLARWADALGHSLSIAPN